jgi:TetR/AcrR family transcriptional repressor of nem operon
MTATGDITAGKIISAGRQFIMRRGYNGFSYADVAEAVDIRKASIHHHFASKNDLVIAVLGEWREAFESDVASLHAADADALARLRAYIGHWERCIADDSAPFCVAGMLGAELPSLPDEVAQAVKRFFDDLAAWLEQVLESGVKADLIELHASVHTEAATLVSVVYGAMLAARVHGDVALFVQVTRGAVERLIKPRKRARFA